MATLARQRGVELYRLEHPRAPGHVLGIWSHGRVLFKTPRAPRWRVERVEPAGGTHRRLRQLVARGWMLVAVWEGHGKRAEALAGRRRCRRCAHLQAHHGRGRCNYVLGCWCAPCL